MGGIRSRYDMKKEVIELLMITHTSFCDGRIMKTSCPISKKHSYGSPNDLKHVLLLIKFAKEKLSYRSDR